MHFFQAILFSVGAVGDIVDLTRSDFLAPHCSASESFGGRLEAGHGLRRKESELEVRNLIAKEGWFDFYFSFVAASKLLEFELQLRSFSWNVGSTREGIPLFSNTMHQIWVERLKAEKKDSDNIPEHAQKETLCQRLSDDTSVTMYPRGWFAENPSTMYPLFVVVWNLEISASKECRLQTATLLGIGARFFRQLGDL